MLDDTKNPLGDEQRKEVTKLIQTWGNYEKVLKKSSVKFSDAWAGIKVLAVVSKALPKR